MREETVISPPQIPGFNGRGGYNHKIDPSYFFQ